MANHDPRSSAAPTNYPQTSTSATPAASTTLEQVMAQLAASQARIADLMEQQAAYNKEALHIAPRRKKTMGEYLAERKARGGGKHLLHDVFQNGRPVNPSGLSQATIELLDTLDTGKYCEGTVDVVRIRSGIDGVNSRIHIMYNNKSVEERMMFYMRFPSFTKLVNDIAADMVAQKVKPVHETAAHAVEPEFPESL